MPDAVSEGIIDSYPTSHAGPDDVLNAEFRRLGDGFLLHRGGRITNRDTLG